MRANAVALVRAAAEDFQRASAIDEDGEVKRNWFSRFPRRFYEE